jgi:hypothetical protein
MLDKDSTITVKRKLAKMDCHVHCNKYRYYKKIIILSRIWALKRLKSF